MKTFTSGFQAANKALLGLLLVAFVAACGGGGGGDGGGGPGTVVQPDRDQDGVPNASDAFPDDPSESVDTDSDGVGDNSDNCVDTANADQIDSDVNGEGDACDAMPSAYSAIGFFGEEGPMVSVTRDRRHARYCNLSLLTQWRV